VIWDGCGFKVVMRRLGESRVGHGGEDGWFEFEKKVKCSWKACWKGRETVEVEDKRVCPVIYKFK
jgi:hypothetical protein